MAAPNSHVCDCGETIEGSDLDEFTEAFFRHARAVHAQEWPFPDTAVRNYAQATQRLTGPSERLDALGKVTIHPVTADRIDDWLAFFDHDGFVGCPQWAACYCTEPLLHDPASNEPSEGRPWQDNRATMVDLLRRGVAFGYLAYVDDRPAAWVNASRRSDCALFRRGPIDPGPAPADEDVVSVSCFVVGPAYRRHGLAGALVDRVVADAASRGATFVEAYPFNERHGGGDSDFRGARSLYDRRGFDPVAVRERDTVVRRPA